jgi:hypothetical protein
MRGRRRHVLALADQLLDALQPARTTQVADDVLRRADRFEDRDARSVEQGEGVGEAREDDLAQDGPTTGSAA